jgi:hypothetical protein
MNTDRLLELADAIERADRFYLRSWATYLDVRSQEGAPPLKDLVHDCGTAGCIGGWTVALFSTRVDEVDEDADEANEATDLLDLEDHEAWRLFYPEPQTCPGGSVRSIWADVADDYGWELPNSNSWEWAEQITAEQAADVLRRIAREELTL